jgi:signal transduction histidine kinase
LNKRVLLVRWGLAVLLVISTAQVGWWILDQWWFTNEVRDQITALHEERAGVAAAMLATGVPAADIERLLPDVEIGPDGRVELLPDLLERIEAERRRRLNQYFWEGSFFLLVLLASITVIGRALREDVRLRRRQQNFLAAVSHEFKSPLAAARVAAETLALRDLDDEARTRHLARVLRGMRRLERLIENLLDSARIDAGALELRPAMRSVASTLEPVLSGFRSRAADRGVDFVVEVLDSLEVFADDIAFCTVVRNLLENAFEAVRRTERPRVRLRTAEDGGFMLLSVADNGNGFDPSEAETLFQQFYRPGDEMRRAGRGAGLGLHIVRALMRSTGGRVQAHSDGPGQGAEFGTYWPPGDDA